MPTLTKSFIDKIEPQDKDYLVWDNKISGFGIKVTPTGRKVYILKYRNKENRQRKPNIGVHGNITCEEARDIAIKWQGIIADGHDPSEDRQELRHSMSISELCDKFLEEYSKVYKKPRSIELDELYINKHIKPSLGRLKVISLDKKDLIKLHSELKSTPTTANRVITLLSKILNLAEDWGIRPHNSNPVGSVKKYKEERKEKYLNNEEISRLFKTLDDLDHEKRESIYFTNMIRLLMLTGARLSEIQHAKWEWVDFKNSIISLPDSKTGKKIIHLSPAAIDVLKNTPKIDKNPYIIVGAVKGSSLNAAQKPWRRVRKIAQLDDVRIHDLRHTFASICVAQGMSLQMVAKLLGHTQTSTSERYAHLAKTNIQDAANIVGNVILGSFRK